MYCQLINFWVEKKKKKRQNSGYLPYMPQSPLSSDSGWLLYIQLICPSSGNEGLWSAKFLLCHSFLLKLFLCSSVSPPQSVVLHHMEVPGCSMISPPPIPIFILTHKTFHLIFSLSCWGGELRDDQDVYLPASQGQPIAEYSILHFIMLTYVLFSTSHSQNRNSLW